MYVSPTISKTPCTFKFFYTLYLERGCEAERARIIKREEFLWLKDNAGNVFCYQIFNL